MTNRFSRAERHALCDSALEAGEHAPTLSGDWTVKDLIVHLLVRERSVLGAPGILVPPLAGVTEWVSRRIAEAPFPALVERFRRPRLTWAAIPAVDAVVNAAEFFVHHEDIRRAKHGWAPRPLDHQAVDVLWRIASTAGRLLIRKAGVPVVIERVDTGETTVLTGGAEPAVVRGMPGELVLFLYGRRELDELDITGPPGAVASVRAAELGI